MIRAAAAAATLLPATCGTATPACATALQRALASSSTDHEPSVMEKARAAVGKVTEKLGEAFEETGAVGSKFRPDGPAGGTAQEIGGPLDKDGAVGHKFTTDGSIGGTVQQAAEKLDHKGEEMQREAAHKQA